MEKLTDKVAYLIGLAEGMKLNADVPEQKILLKMLDVMREFAKTLEEVRQDHDDLSEYVGSIDEDLEEVEAALFDDEFEDDDECGCGHHHGEDDDVMEGEMEYECPHCGYETKFDLADFDFEEDYLCPKCGKSFFPESDEEDEDDEEDEADEAEGKDEQK